MSKGPWRKGKGTKIGSKLGAEHLNGNTMGPETIVSDQPNPATDMPPPMAPFPNATKPASPEGLPSNPLPITPQDVTALKSGLGKTFVSVTKALPYWANVVTDAAKLNLKFEIDTVSPEEGDLWAEFAFPVLDKYMPRFKESPEYALAIITGGILLGKLRIKKKVTVYEQRPDDNAATGGANRSQN